MPRMLFLGPYKKSPGERRAISVYYAIALPEAIRPAMFMKTCATMARVAVPAGLKALLEPERYFSAVQ